MCGIAGELSFAGPPPDPAVLERMTAALLHRGPDDGGTFLDGPVGLGSRRLAILDLSPLGHMPMQDEESGCVLVYNGEIYNSPELRAELLSRGARLRSSGDTEVLLRLLARDGAAALPRLRGMFALALWDRRRRRLLLARDHYGVKPLYWRRDAERLVFGSEMSALLAHPALERRLSPAGLVDYFTLGHTITPHTMIEGIEKLPAGHFVEAGPEGCGAPRAFFDPLELWQEAAGAAPASEAELVERTRAVLAESARRHMLSDVPVGIFLSGGVDSSALTCLLAAQGVGRLRTFSVGFEGPREMNELPEAAVVARAAGTQHEEILLRPDDLAEALLPLVRRFDEPPGDAARFPTWALSRAVAGKVKVVIAGEGGDEMFGGYRRYAAERLYGPWSWLKPVARPLLALAARLAPRVERLRRGLSALDRADPAERALAWQWALAPEALRGLIAPDIAIDERGALEGFRAHYARGAGLLRGADRMMYADQKVRMSDGYCEKVDRSTMAASLEARVPFIDVEVGRLAAAIPPELKVRGPRLKILLRRALEGVVPREVLHRPKRGFAVPHKQWFGTRLGGLLAEVLRPGELRKGGVLRPEAVQELLARRETGAGEAVWLVFAFELWRREHGIGQ